eukprot:1800137-Amphidinium_carterae.1
MATRHYQSDSGPAVQLELILSSRHRLFFYLREMQRVQRQRTVEAARWCPVLHIEPDLPFATAPQSSPHSPRLGYCRHALCVVRNS